MYSINDFVRHSLLIDMSCKKVLENMPFLSIDNKFLYITIPSSYQFFLLWMKYNMKINLLYKLPINVRVLTFENPNPNLMIRHSGLGLQIIFLEIIGSGSRVSGPGSWVLESPGSWYRVPGPTYPATLKTIENFKYELDLLLKLFIREKNMLCVRNFSKKIIRIFSDSFVEFLLNYKKTLFSILLLYL